jgi:glyoxylase I family protein
MKTVGLHHVTIRVADQQSARRFYEDVVGLAFMEIPATEAMTRTWRGAPAQGAFLGAQVGNTFLVIAPPLEGTTAGDRFSEYRIGVDHLALAIDDRSELEALVDRLRGAGVETEGIEVDPVLGKEYAAFRDPDNVQWEAFMV